MPGFLPHLNYLNNPIPAQDLSVRLGTASANESRSTWHTKHDRTLDTIAVATRHKRNERNNPVFQIPDDF